ncbi:MAG: hypothetical protein ACRDGJ_11390 [Candidatus Limnocylindria bacterium]
MGVALSTYFRTEPIDSLDATLFCSTLPNTSDDGIVCLGSVRVTGTSAGERIDALVGAVWASRFRSVGSTGPGLAGQECVGCLARRAVA